MNLRIGHGFDRHKLEPGGGVTLGGVYIKCSKKAIAHSDGDVLIHAITDSILSAIGDGDIGFHFPNTDSNNKDMNSSAFLLDAMNRIRKQNYSICNVSATIICEEPLISPNRELIHKSLFNLIGAPVHVQGKTTESLEFNAIDVHAVTLICKGSIE